MTISTIEKKSGVVQFKSQKEIIADRQRKTDMELQALQKRLDKILKESYPIGRKPFK